jgi:hypothetical protein
MMSDLSTWEYEVQAAILLIYGQPPAEAERTIQRITARRTIECYFCGKVKEAVDCISSKSENIVGILVFSPLRIGPLSRFMEAVSSHKLLGRVVGIHDSAVGQDVLAEHQCPAVVSKAQLHNKLPGLLCKE